MVFFDELPEMPELRFCLKDCTDGLGAKPWHILHDGKEGTKSSMLAERHRSLPELSKRVFSCIAEGLFVCSPELVFVQMASCLSFGELLALGYELCGCYPRSTQKKCSAGASSSYHAEPPDGLRSASEWCKGCKSSRAVTKQVRAKSGSVMETELAAIAFTAEVYGGSRYCRSAHQRPVALSEEARRVARTDWVVLDFYWPKAHFGIEYNGRTAHASADQQDRDSRKRDGLMVDGIETATMTNSQVSECDGMHGSSR